MTDMKRIIDNMERLAEAELDESIGDAAVQKIIDVMFTSSKWTGMMDALEQRGFNDLEVQSALAGAFTKLFKLYFTSVGGKRIGTLSVSPIKHYAAAADAGFIGNAPTPDVRGMGGPAVWNPIFDKMFRNKLFKNLIDRYWDGEEWVDAHESALRMHMLGIVKNFFAGKKAKVTAEGVEIEEDYAPFSRPMFMSARPEPVGPGMDLPMFGDDQPKPNADDEVAEASFGGSYTQDDAVAMADDLEEMWKQVIRNMKNNARSGYPQKSVGSLRKGLAYTEKVVDRMLRETYKG